MSCGTGSLSRAVTSPDSSRSHVKWGERAEKRDDIHLRKALVAIGFSDGILPAHKGRLANRAFGDWDEDGAHAEAKSHGPDLDVSLVERAKSLLRGEEGSLESSELELRAQEALRGDPNAIPPALLRTLSADSLWFLSEAGARHAEVGRQRRRVFDLLRELASLHRERSLSTQARSLLKLALLEGKVDHVATVLGLFRRPAAPVEPASPDASRADSFMAELMVRGLADGYDYGYCSASFEMHHLARSLTSAGWGVAGPDLVRAATGARDAPLRAHLQQALAHGPTAVQPSHP